MADSWQRAEKRRILALLKGQAQAAKAYVQQPAPGGVMPGSSTGIPHSAGPGPGAPPTPPGPPPGVAPMPFPAPPPGPPPPTSCGVPPPATTSQPEPEPNPWKVGFHPRSLRIHSNGEDLDAYTLKRDMPPYRLGESPSTIIWDGSAQAPAGRGLAGGVAPNYSRWCYAKQAQADSNKYCSVAIGDPQYWTFANATAGYPTLVYCPIRDGPSLCHARVWISSVDPLVKVDSEGWLKSIEVTTLYDDITVELVS